MLFSFPKFLFKNTQNQKYEKLLYSSFNHNLSNSHLNFEFLARKGSPFIYLLFLKFEFKEKIKKIRKIRKLIVNMREINNYRKFSH